MKILLALLLISNTSLAAVCDLPVQVKQGQAAPCDGYVFSTANEQKVRTDITFKDLQITSLTKQNAFQQDILNINEKELSSFKEDKKLSEWEKIAFFGLGVVVTGLVAYAAERTLR